MRLDPFALDRTWRALTQAGLTGALFTDYYNVSYLTGYTTFLENGPSPFTRGAAAVLLLPDEAHLVAEVPAAEVRRENWTGTATGYPGYSATGAITGVREFVDATLAMLRQRLPASGRFGLELAHLPAAIHGPLTESASRTWVDLDPQLMLQVRAVKSEEELARIAAAGRLAEVGQLAVRDLVQTPGLTEIEVYNGAKLRIEQAAGQRIALQNALHGGERSAYPVPGMPTNEVLQAGDLIISDMVPYFDGYWADSCSTFAVGGVVTDVARRMHAISRDAFERGFEAARPGITGGALVEIVQGEVKRAGFVYDHHTGHGVGVSNHEEPRITPGSETVLEPGMVVLLEPGVYTPGVGGCRQERMFRITENGAELMTHNPLELT